MSDIIALFGTLQMQIIVIMIAVDVVLEIVARVIKRDFVFRKVGRFMKESVLAYVLGFAVIEMVGQALPRLGFVVWAVFVLVVISLLASLLKNLGRLGLPLPKFLKK